MDSAKRYALVGNILQTIYFVFLFLAGSLNTMTKIIHLVPANAGGGGYPFSSRFTHPFSLRLVCRESFRR